MGFFNNLFKSKREPELDLEKVVGEYLLKLPRCTKDVVIVSPKYGETHYSCEILVEAKNLLPWAENHAESTFSSIPEEEAAKKALPLWLRGAESNDLSKSYVPNFMYEVFRPYVSTFVSDGTAKIYCPECNSIVDVTMEKLNQKRTGGWSWWTDVWKCSQGHQLYYEEHEMHIHFNR